MNVLYCRNCSTRKNDGDENIIKGKLLDVISHLDHTSETNISSNCMLLFAPDMNTLGNVTWRTSTSINTMRRIPRMGFPSNGNLFWLH